MSDPFKITGPAVVSFSGGRTSGYMLYRSIIGNIIARQSAWVERGPYRDPAEVDENEAIPA